MEIYIFAHFDVKTLPETSTIKTLALLTKLQQNYSLFVINNEPALNPMVFVAKRNKADLPTYDLAINGEDSSGYREAMNIEIDELVKKQAWKLVSQAVATSKILGTN